MIENKKKKTVVLGASDNPERYSYLVTARMKTLNLPVVPIGIKEGNIEGTPIITGQPDVADVDTVTLYVGAKNQASYYDYIFKLHPRRIIFNPGAENPELERMAKEKGIETLQACTLTMLSVGNY